MENVNKITHCEDCNTELTYTTKKPKLCKTCHNKKYGDRKFYKQPKTITKKSKGEFALNKLLNEIFPAAASIDGGYYSFLPSPKGYPMQLDRYYPRLHLAFEYNGAQHEQDNDYFYHSDEEFEYRKQCDELKQKQCTEKSIKIVYINHDEFICTDLIIKKLIEANMLDYLKSVTQVNI